MFLKTAAFGLLNGHIPATEEDILEAYQFVVDSGYTQELSATQLLQLRDLVESDKVFTPVLFLPI
jgi:hypothetical protein